MRIRKPVVAFLLLFLASPAVAESGMRPHFTVSLDTDHVRYARAGRLSDWTGIGATFAALLPLEKWSLNVASSVFFRTLFGTPGTDWRSFQVAASFARLIPLGQVSRIEAGMGIGQRFFFATDSSVGLSDVVCYQLFLRYIEEDQGRLLFRLVAGIDFTNGSNTALDLANYMLWTETDFFFAPIRPVYVGVRLEHGYFRFTGGSQALTQAVFRIGIHL